MRKIVLIPLLALFSLSAFASINNAYADTIYDNCLDDKAYGTNFDWQTCGADYLKRVDNDLNKTWREIIDSYQTHQNAKKIKKQLIDQQRLWIAFKEQSCQPFVEDFAGREGHVLGFYACRGDIIEHRIAQLKQFYCNPDATCDFSNYSPDDLLSDLEISDRELNKLYQFVIKRLQEHFADSKNDDYFKQFAPPAISLRDEQRAWVSFKDKACLFMNDLNPDASSPKPIFRINNCEDLITRHRQDELGVYSEMIDFYLPKKPIIDDNQWEIGCDQSYSCTAVWHDGESHSSQPNYIVIKWQYHSKKPVEIRLMLYTNKNNDNKTKENYQIFIQLEQSKTQDFSSYFSVAPLAEFSNGNTSATANQQYVENIFTNLLSQKTLHFGIKNTTDSNVTINLASFQQFYQDTQNYVDFFYPNQVVSLPKVKAYRLLIDDDNAKTPSSLLPSPADDTCSRNIWSDVIFHASNGDRFYALCSDDGAYNNPTFKLLLPDQNFTSYPNEKIDDREFGKDFYNPFGSEKTTMVISNFLKGRGLGDCGIPIDFSYTPEGFRLTKVTRMGACASIDWEDWPVVYRLDVEEIKP